MPQIMTQADYARCCNVTRAAVNEWKRDGRIVMAGPLEDVEASDARLARNRRDGVPPLNPRPPSVRRGRPRRGDFVTLRRDVIAGRLMALDWAQTFDWSDEAQDERARQAALCVGWVALESEVRDDGHWGGFQVRECREEVGPLEDFPTMTVRAELLPVLAYPFDQSDRPRVLNDNLDEWAADIVRHF